jgi:hypothetical protein
MDFFLFSLCIYSAIGWFVHPIKMHGSIMQISMFLIP